jgi:F-type H+-transporting ATPase subunit alpha
MSTSEFIRQIENLHNESSEVFWKKGIELMSTGLNQEVNDFVPHPKVELIPPTYELHVRSVTENVVIVNAPLSIKERSAVDLCQGCQGLVLDIKRIKAKEEGEPDQAEAKIIVLGDSSGMRQGDTIISAEKELSIPFSEQVIGQVVDCFGNVLKGRSGVEKIGGSLVSIFRDAPTILDREEVTRPLHTGVTAIDTLYPIGRGQRQGIVGGQGTGKTELAISTIKAQKGEGVLCFYVAIGKSSEQIAKIVEDLERSGAMDYTTVILAPSNAPDGIKYIVPYCGMALAEGFAYQGKDTLVIIDDLTLNAQGYRSIATDTGASRGREAYPGDIFAIHSTLLERGAQLNRKLGGGSITVLPLFTAPGDDIKSLIPTNIISITDGQIILTEDIFNEDIRPAIDKQRSVSRIGSAAQPEVIRQVVKGLSGILNNYKRIKGLGLDAIGDPATRLIYERGSRIEKILIQPPSENISFPLQAIIIFAAMNGYLDGIAVDNIQSNVRELIDHISKQHSGLIADMANGKATLNQKKDNSQEILKKILASFYQLNSK